MYCKSGLASNGAIEIFISPMLYLLSFSAKALVKIPPQMKYSLFYKNDGNVAILFWASAPFIEYYVLLASHINFHVPEIDTVKFCSLP